MVWERDRFRGEEMDPAGEGVICGGVVVIVGKLMVGVASGTDRAGACVGAVDGAL